MANRAQKFCLITGAAGGIGEAMVQVFNDAGYQVIATDCVLPPENMQCAHFLQADLLRFVRDEIFAETMVSEIADRLNGNGLHALINNAAVQILGGADSLTRDDWQRTLDVNLIAPFLLTQSCLPNLEMVKGCVVNIGSIHARLTKKNFVAYSASKSALAGMTRALAVDTGSRIRINAIEPGAIESAMLRAGFEGKSGAHPDLLHCHPQQRIGQPKEVASLALSIVESDFKFLHGACIGLDGGISSRLFDPD